VSKRVAVYARVSTTRQAENDISIPDQLAQARRYCSERGWFVIREFVDAGASARDDKRSEFQRMMEAACVDPSPFDLILVHSQSRFFRDPIGYGIYKRKLLKHGVSLVSMTQGFGEGPTAEFAETVLAAADALHSEETAKHVSRTMLENARQGFWNGSKPSFGYRTVEVEKRGQRVKKHLEIEEHEAATVRKIFRLFLEGDGTKGPMGIKEITSWLNRNGFRNANGNPFYTSVVHAILTREDYAGTHYYNRLDSRTRRERPRSEWIAVPVPKIVSQKDFKRVQERLHLRNPRTTPTRVTTSDVLLSGIVRCESCGGPMMLRTGTGKSGSTYRYYACAANRLKGRSACNCPAAIPESQLDRLVINALADHLLTPDRLTTLLREAIRHRRALASGNTARRSALRSELKEIATQIDRLLTAVANGTIPDPNLIRQKLDDLNQRREEAVALLAAVETELPELRQALSNQQATNIATMLRHRLLEAPRPLQRRYVHGLVSEIVVNSERAVISGPKEAVAAAITAPDQFGVRTSVREWRTGQDSNPRPPDS
jgi:site-specific DNA recombinase